MWPKLLAVRASKPTKRSSSTTPCGRLASQGLTQQGRILKYHMLSLKATIRPVPLCNCSAGGAGGLRPPAGARGGPRFLSFSSPAAAGGTSKGPEELSPFLLNNYNVVNCNETKSIE